jgi:hypothetical protein
MLLTRDYEFVAARFCNHTAISPFPRCAQARVALLKMDRYSTPVDFEGYGPRRCICIAIARARQNFSASPTWHTRIDCEYSCLCWVDVCYRSIGPAAPLLSSVSSQRIAALLEKKMLGRYRPTALHLDGIRFSIHYETIQSQRSSQEHSYSQCGRIAGRRSRFRTSCSHPDRRTPD